MNRRQPWRQFLKPCKIDGLSSGQQFERDEKIDAVEKITEFLGGKRREGCRILLPIGIMARQDRHRCCEMDDLCPQRLRRLEQWTETGTIGALRGEQRRQVGETGAHQTRHARHRIGRSERQRPRHAVQRQREMRHMEITGADDLLFIEEDDRIVGDRIELDIESCLETCRFRIGRTMDLRHATEGQGILETSRLVVGCPEIGERQQFVARFDFTGLRPDAGRGFGERRRVAAKADKGECASDLERGHSAARAGRRQRCQPDREGGRDAQDLPVLGRQSERRQSCFG